MKNPPEDRHGLSVIALVDGWPGDAHRFVSSLAGAPGVAGGIEMVAVDRSPDPAWRSGWSGPLQVLVPDAAPGFGADVSAALRRAAGRVVVLVDLSLEITGDLFAPLLEALEDPGVAVAGPYGLVSADLCDYEERTDGDVVAVQGYCLAARRAALLAVGGVRETFAWYRNADIDISLRLRAAGEGPPRRAVAVGAEAVVRHTHRAWEATPPEDRDRLSRRNMGKVHDRFRKRMDLVGGV